MTSNSEQNKNLNNTVYDMSARQLRMQRTTDEYMCTDKTNSIAQAGDQYPGRMSSGCIGGDEMEIFLAANETRIESKTICEPSNKSAKGCRKPDHELTGATNCCKCCCWQKRSKQRKRQRRREKYIYIYIWNGKDSGRESTNGRGKHGMADDNPNEAHEDGGKPKQDDVGAERTHHAAGASTGTDIAPPDYDTGRKSRRGPRKRKEEHRGCDTYPECGGGGKQSESGSDCHSSDQNPASSRTSENQVRDVKRKDFRGSR